MAAFTELEKAKIRRQLGYQSWANLALCWGISYPTPLEPHYYIDDALTRMTDEANDLIREDLRQCEAIETQIKECIKRFKASKVGDITTNADEPEALRGELNKWREVLANDFGAFLNPFRVQSASGGSRNGMCVG